MPEWWTYRPSDFRMFSAQTYYRLFELQHAALWPVQLAAAAGGIAVIALLLRPGRMSRRLASALVAAAWMAVAWANFHARYATIHTLGNWLAVAAGGEGLALLVVGMRDRPLARESVPGGSYSRVGVALVALAADGGSGSSPSSGAPSPGSPSGHSAHLMHSCRR